jgi:hypothetical protein
VVFRTYKVQTEWNGIVPKVIVYFRYDPRKNTEVEKMKINVTQDTW